MKPKTGDSVYIRIHSDNIHSANFQQSESDVDALKERPYVEPWYKRSEREMLDRSRPGASGTERALEDRLWQQVSGQGRNKPPSPQFESDWRKLQASLNRSGNIESQLFNEVASSFGKVPTNCQPLTRDR